MNEKIDIDHIPFEIVTHLGTRRLHCVQPNSESINTLIGLIRDDADFIRNLFTHGAFAIQGFSAAKIDSRNEYYEVEFTRAPTKDIMFSIKALNFSTVHVSASFLSVLNDKIKELQLTSNPTPPPWLFRESSLASYPCRIPSLEHIERSLLQDFETALTDYLRMNNPERASQHFSGRLKLTGLQSPQYQKEKRRWLDTWGCENIQMLYATSVPEQAPNQSSEIPFTTQDVSFLETKILELEELKGKNDARLAGEVTACRGVVLQNLYPLIEIARGTEAEKLLRNNATVETYYDAIMQLNHYYHSRERQEIFTGIIPSLKEACVSIEHFLNTTENNLRQFSITAQCEKIFATTPIKENGAIFTRLEGKRIKINTAKDDGVNLRIVSIEPFDASASQ